MSRARNIKPGFFANEDLADLTAHTRLLFIGLWTLADRRGILEDRPRRISGDIFRYEQLDVEPMLAALAQKGFIERYEVDGIRCILVTKFGEHQNPHSKEQANTLPAPCKPGASPVQTPDKQDASPADSLLLIPDSGILNPESPTLNPESEDTPLPPKGDELPAEFVEFWRCYPSGFGSKPKSLQAWKKVRREHPEIMAGLEQWHRSERWQNGFVKAAEIWLRDRLWENPPPPPKVHANSGNPNPYLNGWKPGSGPAPRKAEDWQLIHDGRKPTWGSANGGLDAI